MLLVIEISFNTTATATHLVTNARLLETVILLSVYVSDFQTDHE